MDDDGGVELEGRQGGTERGQRASLLMFARDIAPVL